MCTRIREHRKVNKIKPVNGLFDFALIVDVLDSSETFVTTGNIRVTDIVTDYRKTKMAE